MALVGLWCILWCFVEVCGVLWCLVSPPGKSLDEATASWVMTSTMETVSCWRDQFLLTFTNLLLTNSKFSLIKSYYMIYRLHEYLLENSGTLFIIQI